MSEPTNHSRRDFLKSTAAAGAAAAVASSFVARSAHAAGDETIKIALIGCGGRGSGAASQALSTKGPVKLIAVADAFADNAHGAVNNLKNQFGDKVDVPEDRIFHGFDAYKQAIDSGADLIVIATPPGFRPIHFEYAVKQNKNVFAEKPVATDAGGIRRFLAAAQEAKAKNLKVGIGLQRHHEARYIETVKRIHDGALGDTRMLRVYWNGDSPWVRPRQPGQTEMEYQMRNWYYFVWLCGDHINEQHIHNLDVANWIMKGPPVMAQGQGGRQVRNGKDHGEIYDHHMIEYTYADGTKMLSQCRHMPNCQNDVSEHATGVKAYCNVGGGSIEALGNNGGENWRYKGPNPNPYQVEHDDLFDAIRNNKPYMEAEYGATSTMTALLGRMCTYSGQVIKWEDAINAKESVMPKVYSFDAAPPTLPDADGRYSIAMPGQSGDDVVWKRVNKEIMSWARR
ncbi:MAG TPA: Gfo/Idh/MocA family oxidoreductase [Tepidisphaeraceae bacterium]|jgi:predicted dehydrogenase|nr:Gfo/Idh/MocA family oxidoreductase [Tepidisphaeraceae bacterium]